MSTILNEAIVNTGTENEANITNVNVTAANANNQPIENENNDNTHKVNENTVNENDVNKKDESNREEAEKKEEQDTKTKINKLKKIIHKVDLAGLKEAISHGLNVNQLYQFNPYGDTQETLLTYTIASNLRYSNVFAIVKILLEEGKADPNVCNSNGEMPLRLKCGSIDQMLPTINLLLEHGAKDPGLNYPGARDLFAQLETEQARFVACESADKKPSGDSHAGPSGGAPGPNGGPTVPSGGPTGNASESADRMKNADKEKHPWEYLDNPRSLATIQCIVHNTAQKMLSDPRLSKNIFNDKKSLPELFTSIKFKIPEYCVMPFKDTRIITIQVVAGHDSESTLSDLKHDDNFFRELNKYFEDYDSEKHRNIVLKLVLQNGEKQILTLQNKEDAMNLLYALAQFSFYEEPYVRNALPEDKKQWKELENYIDEVTEFYREELHPEMLKDFEKNVLTEGAIIIELGAGTGALSRKLFESLAKDKEIHIIGTEYLKDNVQAGKQELADKKEIAELCKDREKTIDFYVCNSVRLLDCFKKSGLFYKINELQEAHFKKHNRYLPIMIASSGALNRIVLADTFESLRVMQNLYRLQPSFMAICGLTETLLNKHIIKNVGFELLNAPKKIDSNYFTLKANPLSHLVKKFERKLRSHPKHLDLTLNPVPSAIIQKIDPDLLKEITQIDVSHAFFANEQEWKTFFERVHKACPKLEEITYGYHFLDEECLIDKVRTDLKSQSRETVTVSDKLKISFIARSQEIAFSKRCIDRIINIQSLELQTQDVARQNQNETKSDRESSLIPTASLTNGGLPLGSLPTGGLSPVIEIPESEKSGGDNAPAPLIFSTIPSKPTGQPEPTVKPENVPFIVPEMTVTEESTLEMGA